jgi:formylglycine-generating enzyme required for sulfatase activity
MAPEQFRDTKDVDLRADIFALGCILYELVCGQRPFQGSDLFAIQAAVASGRYTPPESLVPALPWHLVNAIHASLSPDPAARPESCESLLEMVRTPERAARSTVASGTPTNMPTLAPPGPASVSSLLLPGPSMPPASRLGMPWLLGTRTMLLLVVVGTVAIWWAASRQDAPLADVESEPSPATSIAGVSPPPALAAMTFVAIPAGAFVMGSPPEEKGREPDEDRHSVSVRPFLLQTTEVTQAQFAAAMGFNPVKTGTAGDGSQPAGACRSRSGVSLIDPEYPVVCVSWYDAIELANALSARDGFAPAYVSSDGVVTWNRSADGYRLPTEEEWEYAARAGTTTPWGGLSRSEREVCELGNIGDMNARASSVLTPLLPATLCDDGVSGLARVGTFRPNPWGLFDMVGNSWEWNWDLYGAYATPPTGADRVLRSGTYYYPAVNERVANRDYAGPNDRSDSIGFRLARSPRGADAGSAVAATRFDLVVTGTPRGPDNHDPGIWRGVRHYVVAEDGAALVAATGIGAGALHDPYGLAYRASSRELFVGNRHGNVAADGVAGSIQRFVYDSGTHTFTANGEITGNGLDGVHQLAFSPDTGELFAANVGSGISRFMFDASGAASPNGDRERHDARCPRFAERHPPLRDLWIGRDPRVRSRDGERALQCVRGEGRETAQPCIAGR